MFPTVIPAVVPGLGQITNDYEHEAAISQMIARNQAPDAANDKQLETLADAVAAYEEAAGHAPKPPQTLRGILEVEMFKRRIRQRQLAEILDVSEPRLSELMKGKRAMNLDFARRLHDRLRIPAEVVLHLTA